MRRALVVLAAFSAACASSGSSSEVAERAQPIFTSSETGTLMGSTPQAASVTVQAAEPAVWAAVKKVYADWNVPLNVENPATHEIGNNQFVRTRQFAGHSMIELADCGSGPEGQKAGSYRMYLSLLTVVSTNSAGTKVETAFVPVGQDVTGTSSTRIPCGSTGRLEQYFLAAVKANLGQH
ncbi:MAG TPA: hypothetical protein VHB25_06405 [Gemmatimonadaceae bacterium]|nr:hypothetical protein [Gemmatimonadaceae bacterium]